MTMMMHSTPSCVPTGFFLQPVYVLLICTLVQAASSQAQESTSQIKSSESNDLSMKIRHLILRALEQQQQQAAAADGYADQDDIALPPYKRVFCNSFGGCRSLKRLFNDEPSSLNPTSQDSVQPTGQEADIDKRVFCNSYGGCKSFKRVSANAMKNPALSKNRQRQLRGLKLRPISVSKRVFCNSFGGCQN